jgi:RND family efflux transporter MFP subunit
MPACSHEKTGTRKIQSVKTDTVRAYGELSFVTFPGKVRAASDVNLSFRISGPIAKVYVGEGRYVRKGEVLAEMDSRDYAIQLEATEAEYEQVKAEAGRIIAMYEKDAVTPNDFDKAVYGLRQITAKREAHLNALADTRLYAPFDGYVQRCFFGESETVGAGTPVVSLIDAGCPEVEINIPAPDFVRREMFDSFTCSVDIYPGRVFPLQLVGVARKANLNQLYTMRLRVRDTEGILPSPGMTALVNIYLRADSVTDVSVPVSAVFEAGGGSAVWVYDGETESVRRRAVRIGAVLSGGAVAIERGVLRAGEIVVTGGVHSLYEGEKVRPLPAVSPTNVGGLL